MKLKYILAALCCGALLSCSQREQANYQVIPLPQEIDLTEGKNFVLDKSLQIIVPEGNAQLQRNAQFLSEYVKEATGMELTITTDETVSPAIRLALGVDNENKEDPYTDDELAQMLGEKGYPIARRTVAKYRQQLNIPTARLRR